MDSARGSGERRALPAEVAEGRAREPELAMEPEPGPGPDPGPGLDPDPGVDPGPDPAMGPRHDPVTEPAPVTDPATDPDVEPLHRGGFRCRLCQITTANLPSLRSHLAGKRHRRLRCLRAERRAQEQRSLFVSGFARGTAPERLRRHFRAFGPVATVVMDKEKGAFAIVELRDAAGRQRALEQPRHFLEGRRLRVRPREHRGFPRDPPRDPPGTPPRPPGLLQALGRAQDVGAQLALLVRALELSAAERRLRELLVALIQEVFTEFFPGCSVVPYGSSVNGFDVHGCDLDLHLELGDPPSPETPNGDPQNPETPNGDPQNPETPNGDPQNPKTPNGDPPSLRTPNGDPQNPMTPNGDPQSPETPNGDPQKPKTPNGDPQNPETPNGNPPSLRTPNGDPQNPVTPNGDPQKPKTPNGDPQISETPKNPNPDPNGDPQIPETPNGDPPPNGSLLGDREDPTSRGSLLGDKASVLGSEGSLLGSPWSDRDPSLEGSLLGSEGSRLGSEGSRLGSEGSILGSGGSRLGSEGSILGSEGSILGSEGSRLGSEGSRLGSPGDPDPLLGSEAASPGGSPCGSEGSPSGDESSDPEGSLLGSGGSLLGCGGSLLGRGAPPARALALVGAVLRRCVPGVRRVRAVPGARRPVVKFSHKQSGLAGDVCLDNRLALFNTRFLRLCADADPRVRPLGYALRLWAGGQRLAGNRAGGGPLLTNYALTLLLVLFLQSRSPPVLPSVRRLRLLAGPQDRAQVGGWDCSFPRDAAALEPSRNGQSAASLLAEFFSYFGTLDLGALLLSPLEGRALPRPPPETLGGLRPGPLTLQDPFELSHNVAANVTARTVSRFVRCCRDAARLCRGPEFLQKSRRGRPWGVMRLLQPGNPENPGSSGGSEGKFLIPVPLRPPGGCGGVPRREVCAAVGFVLAEVLGCGCEPDFGDTGTPGEAPPVTECHLQGVAGGSPGEFGDTGTPGDEEEPPPVTECHLQGVAGGSPGEFGDTGTPGDEEEPLPDPSEPPPVTECHLEKVTGGSRGEFGDAGTPGPGSKRRLPEGVADGAGVPPSKRPRCPAGPSRWSCCVWYRVWRGRRRLRRRLHRGGTEGNRGAQGPEGPGGAQGLGGVRDPGGVQGTGGSQDPGGPATPGGVQDPGGLGGSQDLGVPAAPGGVQGPGGPGGLQDFGGSPLALERAVTEAIVRGDTGTPPGPPPEPLLRFQLSARPGGSRRDPQMLLQLQPDPPSPLFQEFFHFLRSFLPAMVRQCLGWGAGGAEPPGGGGQGGEFVNFEVLQ